LEEFLGETFRGDPFCDTEYVKGSISLRIIFQVKTAGFFSGIVNAHLNAEILHILFESFRVVGANAAYQANPLKS
jgi:hypothetical protein